MSKDIRVAVCVPTSGMCTAWFAHSLVGLFGYANSLAARGDSEALLITLFMQESSVIHANREKLILQSLKWGATHILFLDDDMIFDPRILATLLGRRQSFVGCNYLKRYLPPQFTAVKPDQKNHIITREESTGLEEAHYTGFGCALIEAEVFEKTPQPWFLPLYHEHIKEYTTEDNPFCERIRAAGFKVYCDHDASKMISHRGAFSYSWEQWRPEPQKPSAEVVPIKTGEKA